MATPLTKWTFAVISVNSLCNLPFVHTLVHRNSIGDHHHQKPQSFLNSMQDDIHTKAAKIQFAQASKTQEFLLNPSSSSYTCPNGHKIEADDAKYLTCPPGPYLSDQSHEKARERLLNAFCLAKSQGQEGGNARETQFYKTRGHATFESSMWPKPETCRQLPDEDWDHKNQPYRVDETHQFATKLLNTKFGAEFHKIWKVASSSFPDYLLCALGDWEIVPVPEETPQGTKAVTAVREPIDRWISGMGELLRRSIDHICPVGRACSSEIDWFEPSTTLPDLRHTTTWYQVIEAGFKSSKLAELVAAFVHDTQCNFQYWSAEHFTTQTTFMTQNNGTALDQDLVMKLEEMEDGMKQFHAMFGGNPECKLNNIRGEKRHLILEPANATAWPILSASLDKSTDLPLPTASLANATAGEHDIPDAKDILHALEGNDELMRALCAVYAQDFICFNYDLPRACKGMF